VKPSSSAYIRVARPSSTTGQLKTRHFGRISKRNSRTITGPHQYHERNPRFWRRYLAVMRSIVPDSSFLVLDHAWRREWHIASRKGNDSPCPHTCRSLHPSETAQLGGGCVKTQALRLRVEYPSRFRQSEKIKSPTTAMEERQ